MYIWKISQSVNDGYDTYDSAIVYAETWDEARNTHPNPNWEDYCVYYDLDPTSDDNIAERGYGWERSWAPVEDVVVENIGERWNAQSGVILASYNAG